MVLNVQKFLENLKITEPDKAKIIIFLRKMILQAMPGITEVFMYGGIVYKAEGLVFKTEEPVLGLFVRKKHVSIEFGRGNELPDLYSVLEGSGKERRHIKVFTYCDIRGKNVEFYIEKFCNLQKR